MEMIEVTDQSLSVSEEQIKEFNKKFAIKEIKKELLIHLLADCFAEIEVHDVDVSDVVVCPKTYTLLRQTLGNRIDAETNGKKLKNGLFVYLWGARVWVSESAKKGVVKCYERADKKLIKDFPEIVKAKKNLKIID